MNLKKELADLRNALTPISLLLDRPHGDMDEYVIQDAREGLKQSLTIIDGVWDHAEEKEAEGG